MAPLVAEETLTRPDALLVIAHPDDECMFFGPSLLGMRSIYRWRVLCLSTGTLVRLQCAIH
jgi:LmbE family N-acetylglucosaminyl deacetylase